MASRIWLGALYPAQLKMDETRWESNLKTYRGYGAQAVIAKGNIIEGIEAKA